ncbi:hypothetical protein [Nostoc sp.]|uniref:hypothetical protein n=1 Tax=Nostoc sp. TaxID=1180 RepID=UPI002FF4D22C
MRQDSLLYARHKEPDDPGVAVYFKIKNKNYALCCVDTERRVVRHRPLKIRDNLTADGLHINEGNCLNLSK